MATEDELNDALNDLPGGDDPDGYEPDDEQGDDHADEQDDDAQGGGDDEGDEGAPHVEALDALLGDEPQNRGQNRVQRLANERKAAIEEARAERERATKLEDELAEHRIRERYAAEQRQQREEAELDPEERRIRGMEREIAESRFRSNDNSDRQMFRDMVANSPALKGMEKDVETELARARSKGINPTREATLQFLLGQRAMERLKTAPKAKKQAQQRVDAARGAPLNARSNAAPASRRDTGGKSDAERRLTGIKL
jgi:hypothetical protein